MELTQVQTVSIVIPVYSGEQTLPSLIKEISPFTVNQETPGGNQYIISEVILVYDNGQDNSDHTIQTLCGEFSFVRPVWLTKNFGQHAATLAGMSSAASDWIVTIDEDGQQAPSDIAGMLDHALAESLQFFYAKPVNPPPHGFLRNFFSRTAKKIAGKLLKNPLAGQFNSFRLVDGEIARILAAYSGNGIYLDVAIFWIAGHIGHYPVRLRREFDRPSGYSYFRLFSHFWRLILSTGTRPLRLITFLGIGSVAFALFISIYAITEKLIGNVPIQGWTSLVIITSFFSGCILISLGLIAEYLAMTLSISLGKPLYVISSKPPKKGKSK